MSHMRIGFPPLYPSRIFEQSEKYWCMIRIGYGTSSTLKYLCFTTDQQHVNYYYVMTRQEISTIYFLTYEVLIYTTLQ